MSDSDSDAPKKEIDTPPFKLRHSDMPMKLVREIVRCKES